jgi:membrane protease YdiL (CAAX protease family)
LSPSDLPPDVRPDGTTDEAGATQPPPSAPGGSLIPVDPPDGVLPPAGYRPGASTFTIEGRSAPALFVVGWLATIVGLGSIAVAFLSGDTPAGRLLLIIGAIVLALGLIAAAGSQGIERRVRSRLAYVGPSPFLVFAASIPVSIVLVVLVAIPLDIVGVALDGPLGALLSVGIQAAVYLGLVRLLVVDTGALDWTQMGVRRLDRQALMAMAGGAGWAIPVFAVTTVVGGLLQQVFRVTPPNPLPPTGDPLGFGLSLLAGVIVAPFGEEILFRAFATTAWVRGMGERRGLIRAAVLFAFAHILTIAGSSADQALALALVAFLVHLPVAVALGWIFVRRGTIWASFGLHATYNAIILVIVEVASRST